MVKDCSSHYILFDETRRLQGILRFWKKKGESKNNLTGFSERSIVRPFVQYHTRITNEKGTDGIRSEEGKENGTTVTPAGETTVTIVEL